MNRGLFIEINRCIYCGKNESGLHNEHGVPVGLLPKGEPGLVLRSASCQSCAEKTSLFERAVLQRLWQPARAGLGLRSYRKRLRPPKYPLTIVRDGGVEHVMLPFDEFPATMQFIEYPPPAILEGKLHKNGILTNASRLIQVAGPPLDKVAKKLSAQSFQFASLFIGLTFEKLLLKVAYCFAIAALGFENIMECYVVPSILGTSEEIGTWLGCDGKECLKPGGFHSASISVVEKQIICRLRLFSTFPVPEYVVVVGKINEELTKNMPLSNEKHF